MRRPGGWTLIELLVVVTMMVVVGGTMATVASMIRAEERLSAACAQDLAGLRRAVQALERDLRRAHDLDTLDWKLVDGTLLRGGRPVARHVARFAVARDGPLARVELALGPRSDAPHRREAALAFAVRLRRGEGP